MTLQQAKELLRKAQANEPLTADEKARIKQAFRVVASSIFNQPN